VVSSTTMNFSVAGGEEGLRSVIVNNSSMGLNGVQLRSGWLIRSGRLLEVPETAGPS
jgi:hypothetical protein